MKRLLLAATAALALAACAEAGPSFTEPAPPSFATGDAWSIFPDNPWPAPGTTTFTGAGWEVGTQFYTTVAGCVHYLRFWRASGETGTNTIKLWTGSGTKIVARTVALTGNGTGWQYAHVSSIVCLQPNTYYRVSVNTNTAQVKTPGFFANGPVVRGPLVGTSGYYGQPTGSMPSTQSVSGFWVDVVFVES